jgi:hypothetical protein
MSISSIYQAKEGCLYHPSTKPRQKMNGYLCHPSTKPSQKMNGDLYHPSTKRSQKMNGYLCDPSTKPRRKMNGYLYHPSTKPSQKMNGYLLSIYQAKPKLHGYLYHPSSKPSQNCVDNYIIHLPSQRMNGYISHPSTKPQIGWKPLLWMLEGFWVLNPRPALATRLVDKEGNTQASHKHAQPNSRASAVFCERGSHGEFGMCSCANRARKKQSRGAAVVFPRTVFEFLF